MEAVHGIGAVAKQLILRAYKEQRAMTNEQLAELVVQIFKAKGIAVKTGAASIAWYKNDMRKKGQLPKGSAQSAKSIAFNIDEINFDINAKPIEQGEERAA